MSVGKRKKIRERDVSALMAVRICQYKECGYKERGIITIQLGP